MNELKQITQGLTVTEVLTWIVALSFVLSIAYKAYQRGSKLYERQQERKLLEQTVLLHTEQIGDLGKDIKEVKDDLKVYAKDSRDYRRISLADKIYRKYAAYTARGDIEHAELVNFNMCVQQYLCTLREGEEVNDIVLHKYAPEVRALPMRFGELDELEEEER